MRLCFFFYPTVSFPCPSFTCWPFTTGVMSQTRTGKEAVTFTLTQMHFSCPFFSFNLFLPSVALLPLVLCTSLGCPSSLPQFISVRLSACGTCLSSFLFFQSHFSVLCFLGDCPEVVVVLIETSGCCRSRAALGSSRKSPYTPASTTPGEWRPFSFMA